MKNVMVKFQKGSFFGRHINILCILLHFTSNKSVIQTWWQFGRKHIVIFMYNVSQSNKVLQSIALEC